MIEWFPYHSKASGLPTKPVCPSQDYSFQLAQQELLRSKIVVGMRSKKQWLNALPAVQSVPFLKNPQNPHISPANTGTELFDRIVEALRQNCRPIVMRDSYVADVGDFGKYALLNALAGDDLRLGVLWCRNSEPDATQDGRFTEYPELRACDPDLYDRLAQILKAKQRSLAHRRAARIYYILPAEDHEARIVERLTCFLAGGWGKHFRACDSEFQS